MKLEDTYYQKEADIAATQAATSTMAQESEQIWDRVIEKNTKDGVDPLIAMEQSRKDLRRAVAMEQLLDKMMTEAILKSGVDWSKDPELMRCVVGDLPREKDC